MKLNIIEFPSTLFEWTDNRQLNANASALGNKHLQPLNNGRFGFAVKSERTGNVVTYSMMYAKKDEDYGDWTEEAIEQCSEGGIRYWEYMPTVDSIKTVPDCAGTKAIIWND